MILELRKSFSKFPKLMNVCQIPESGNSTISLDHVSLIADKLFLMSYIQNLIAAYQSAQQGGNPFGGGGGFGGTDPHDLFNQIFKEFGGMGGQQGGFSFGDFAQQMQNRPQVEKLDFFKILNKKVSNI